MFVLNIINKNARMFMIDFLDKIRKPEKRTSQKRIMYSLFFLLFGILLGTTSKFLDEIPSNLLPSFIEVLDLRNFFSRIGIWLFLSVVISIYSQSPMRAAIHVFLFLTGMVGSYYLVTVYVVGFFPKSYMMIWVILIFLSPLLAFISWYAKGRGTISMIISAFILVFMTRQAFAFGYWYLDITNILELILWLSSIFILYQSPKQILTVVTLGGLLFVLMAQLNLLWGML